MPRKVLLFIFSLFSALLINAQNLPPVYEIKADTGVNIPDSYWQVLEDSSGKISINDLRKDPLNSRFHKNNTGNGRAYAAVHTYWQRVRLRNSSGKSQKLIFFNNPWADRYDIYLNRSNGKSEHLVSGDFVPFSKRDGDKGAAAVSLEIGAGEEVELYKRIYFYRANHPKELTLSVSFLQKAYNNVISYASRRYVGDIRNGFIGGLLIFGFLINLFFFRINREKLYLYFALFQLTEGLWYLSLNPNLMWQEHRELLYTYGVFVSSMVCFLSTGLFVREFLKTYKYYPLWDKALLFFMSAWAVVSSVAYFIEPGMPGSWKGISDLVENIAFSMMMISLFVTFLLRKKEKDAFTGLALVGALPAFFMWGFYYGIRSIWTNLADFGVSGTALLTWMQSNSNIIEMWCVSWFTVVFTWILVQRYAILRKQLTLQALEREKERTELMRQQTVELERMVDERTAELKHSLEELQATQKQLIQSEKMASLGELTAGIAHEIQNPLNFINNFSEVSTELADELDEEVEAGNKSQAKIITADLKQNLDKILHHGKRADSIVKNMLQHSRQSTGEKELTDINVLVEECLRLSYHGLRAKDKSFNAIFETHFDPAAGKVKIVSQDISRVLLNLFNNSFYSVMQKKKRLGSGFEPIVSVSTKRTNYEVLINVRDNGLGIPENVLEKIYQPFFTTKPAGEGTGLGLSMSYDIVTKGHGGSLRAETEEGQFAEFNISLPV